MSADGSHDPEAMDLYLASSGAVSVDVHPDDVASATSVHARAAAGFV